MKAIKRSLCMAQSKKCFSTILKRKMDHQISEKVKDFAKFMKEFGENKIEDIQLSQVIGGMRGMTSMIYETSKLHHIQGINYRNKDLYEIRDNAPTAPGGFEPLPEGILWLLLTGEFPDQKELKEFQEELYRRGRLADEVEKLIQSFPKDMHPMTQFSMGIMACQPYSKFAKAYQDGVPRNKLWESTLEDTIDVCGKVSRIAALVYNNCYKYSNDLPDADPSLDYAANFAQMLGFNDQAFWELMRLYLVLHADHEGGNVSAHTTHLVGSALADPYLALAAGMNGLSGPLHGLANQECLQFLLDFQKKYGKKWTEHDIREYVNDILESDRVVPGYGHPVLRQTDPRFICELEFANKYIKNDNLVDLVRACYRVIPDELNKTDKVSNPWPNVDAASGALLMHYGLNNFDYYTVLFGVSRTFGVTSSLVWSRALGFPIERPNSVTLDYLMKKLRNQL